MGVFDRVILTLYTFCLTFVSFAIVLMALGWDVPLESLAHSLSTAEGKWATGIVGAAFLVVSLRLLYFAFRRRQSTQAVVHETGLGDVRVSMDAVENLVRRVVKQTAGVRDVRARVVPEEAGVSVSLTAAVSPDTNIPELSDEIQNSVKNFVRDVVGINVSQVRIFVENITDEGRKSRARVE